MTPTDSIITQAELVNWTQAPGLSYLERTQQVHDFLNQFNEMLMIYRAAYGDPTGKSVESHLDKVKWYLDFHSKNAS